jgi:signal peptidase I
VNKYDYGLRLPVLNRKIVQIGEPKRGDVVVFHYPGRDSEDPQKGTDYIKRVIGLPGDRIQMIQGVLHINGTPVKRERVEDFVDVDESGRSTRVRQWRETLPNGVSYRTLELPYNLQSDNTDVYHDPADNYIMMGDNRHNSTDSRFPQVGYVPFQNLIGRAQIIFFSVLEGERAWEVWRWPWTVRWSRLFTIVR